MAVSGAGAIHSNASLDSATRSSGTTGHARSGCRHSSQVRHDFFVATFLGKSQSVFPIVGLRMQICAVFEQEFYNSQMSIRRSCQKRRISFCVTVVHVRSIFHKPLRDGSMAASDGTSQRGVAAAVCGNCVYVCTVRVQVACDLLVTEGGCERNYRKAVWRISLRGRRVSFDEFLNPLEATGGDSFVQFELRAFVNQQVANFFAARVAGHQNGRHTLFISCIQKGRLRFDQTSNFHCVASAHCFKQLRFIHRSPPVFGHHHLTC